MRTKTKPSPLDLRELEAEYYGVKTPDDQPDFSDAEVEFAYKLYELFPILLALAQAGSTGRDCWVRSNDEPE